MKKSMNTQIEWHECIDNCFYSVHFHLIDPFDILNSGHLILIIYMKLFFVTFRIQRLMKTCIMFHMATLTIYLAFSIFNAQQFFFCFLKLLWSLRQWCYFFHSFSKFKVDFGWLISKIGLNLLSKIELDLSSYFLVLAI
jgi:hypothetical protein